MSIASKARPSQAPCGAPRCAPRPRCSSVTSRACVARTSVGHFAFARPVCLAIAANRVPGSRERRSNSVFFFRRRRHDANDCSSRLPAARRSRDCLEISMLARKNRAKSMLGNDNSSRGRAAAEPAADERAEAAVEQRDDDGLGHLRICRWRRLSRLAVWRVYASVVGRQCILFESVCWSNNTHARIDN